MDAPTIHATLGETFGARIDAVVRSAKRLYVRLDAADLPEVVRWLREHLAGIRLATATGVDLRDGIGLFHHFAINGSPLVVTLKVLLAKPEPRAPTLADQIAAADWIEREIHDLLGVTFDGHPDLRRLLKAEPMAGQFPLRRDFDAARVKEPGGDGSDV